ncbi:MAG: hypothetical protein LBT74_03655 [Acidobacteriota bacterium]|jgi:hypothetical protein|nr:hypothetical protein [Acidobacteriota bacterium]
MKGNLALFAQIASKSFLAGLRVLLGGGLASLLALGVAIAMLVNNPDPADVAAMRGAGAGRGAPLDIALLLAEAFWATLLLFCSFAGLWLSSVLAGKQALQTATHLVWRHKLGGFFVSRVTAYLDRLCRKRDGRQAATSADAVKRELLDSAKADTGIDRRQRRVMRFFLKRLRLDGIDFSKPHAEVRAALVERLRQVIDGAIEPSLTPFWCLVAGEAVLTVLALVFDQR